MNRLPMNFPGLPQGDDFSDVIENQTGIFNAAQAGIDSGLKNFETVRTVPKPHGVITEMQCRKCGRPIQLCIEYPELVAVRYNVAPHVAFGQNVPGMGRVVEELTPWAYSQVNSAWWPMQKCRQCNEYVAPLFSQEEAEKHLKFARAQQWILPQAEQAISVHCARVAQHLQSQQGGR